MQNKTTNLNPNHTDVDTSSYESANDIIASSSCSCDKDEAKTIRELRDTVKKNAESITKNTSDISINTANIDAATKSIEVANTTIETNKKNIDTITKKSEDTDKTIKEITHNLSTATDTIKTVKTESDKKIDDLTNTVKKNAESEKKDIAKCSRRKIAVECIPEKSFYTVHGNEVRVVIPSDTKWGKDQIGYNEEQNQENYLCLKYYAPDNAVYLRQALDTTIPEDKAYYSCDVGESFHTEKNSGLKYGCYWIAMTKRDSDGNTIYAGFDSGTEANNYKYRGCFVTYEFYDKDKKIIAKDLIRLNLVTDDCIKNYKPWYMNEYISKEYLESDEGKAYLKGLLGL